MVIQSDPTQSDGASSDQLPAERIDDANRPRDMVEVAALMEAATGQPSTSKEKPADLKRQSKKLRSVESFEELGMSLQLLEAVRAVNIEKPNDLQKILLPEIFTDRAKDFYLKSTPHAGKKTAFLISALHRILLDQPKSQVIILEPTSELGEYIFRSANALAQHTNIKVLRPTPDQSQRELMSSHLIVTSLNGLLTYLENGCIVLNELKCLIFDEVDLLLGSEKKQSIVNKIVRTLAGKNCQLLFFSTFYGGGSVEFARKLRPDRPRSLIVLNLTVGDFKHNLFQFYSYSPDHATKLRQLIKVLQNTILNKIVLFVTLSDKMQSLNEHLQQASFRTIFLTNNTSGSERLEAIDQFNAAKEQTILITHYPLTHGIRLNDVRMVINFDLPAISSNLIVEYVHKMKRCETSEERPCFAVNLSDSYTGRQLSRIQKFFKYKLIRLNLSDEIGSQLKPQ